MGDSPNAESSGSENYSQDLLHESSDSEHNDEFGPDEQTGSTEGNAEDVDEEEENEHLDEHEDVDEEEENEYLDEDEGLLDGESYTSASGLISLLLGNRMETFTPTKSVKYKDEHSPIKHTIARDFSYDPISWSPVQKKLKTNTSRMVCAREIGINFKRRANVNLVSRFIPNTFAKRLDLYTEQLFCGQFSSDGNVFLSACQDTIIRLYHTPDMVQWAANPSSIPDDEPEASGRGLSSFRRYHPPPPPGTRNPSPKPFREVECRGISWSIISTDFSPDNKWIAYSSWSPYVHLANIFGEYERHEALDFDPPRGHFCLFSIQFSPCNTHIAGGGSDDHVYLYNLERKTVVSRVRAHKDDVNAVKYSDESSHLLFSGSDDGLVKVWDTRSMRKAVGVLAGHSSGITYIDSKGDGYHLLSNSKDQSIKLWDIRSMKDPKKIKNVSPSMVDFDYRWQQPRRTFNPTQFREDDASVATFTGHRVVRTLIRCHFSPAFTTAQRHVVAGSGDGGIYIWDILDGKLVEKLDWHDEAVRDVAWHPYRPLIASSSWDHTVGLWDYKGDQLKSA